MFAHWLRDTPLNTRTCARRETRNVFAVESFTDESPRRPEPIPAFRLQRLSDPRALEVIKRAATAFGWDSRPSPNPKREQGSGRGMAYIRYKQAENYVATFMEVAVDRSTGAIRVKRVVCAHDCGLVVNPTLQESDRRRDHPDVEPRAA